MPLVENANLPVPRRLVPWLLGGLAAVVVIWLAAIGYRAWLESRFDPQLKRTPLNAPYIPSPQDVVDRMLALADLDQDDVIYDLGCGDGRIVITAAKRYGCRGIGYEYDPQIAELARQNAKEQGVEHLVTIEQRDIFTIERDELNRASAITLYLLPWMNEKLLPTLCQLDPGKVIVSHSWDLPGYPPDHKVQMDSQDDDTPVAHEILVWKTPLKKGTSPPAAAPGRDRRAARARGKRLGLSEPRANFFEHILELGSLLELRLRG